MNWEAVTAIGTLIYVILVLFTLFIIYYQLRELVKSRTAQTSLALFNALQATEARQARKYIHDNLPIKITKLTIEELETHLEGIYEAVVIFDRIGYFLQEKLINESDIVPLFWAIVWRCWKKSEKLIRFARRKRGDLTYRAGFEYFFIVSEKYREKCGYRKPKYY